MHLVLVSICALALVCISNGAYTLSDQQIVGGTVLSLNGEWQAYSPAQNLKMNGYVPGDITTDLYRAGHIPEPNTDLNWLTNGNIWAKNEWLYNTSFSLSSQDIAALSATGSSAADILLVFDGIKMAANIYVNNHLIDTSISQFLRLNYSLRAFQAQTKALVAGENTLSVVFDPSLQTHGLFAQCSGGWDWAPYSNLATSDNYAMYSIGIWKDVYLVWIPWLGIVDTVVHTFYTGPFTTEALKDGQHSPFEVAVTLYTYNFASTAVSNVVLEVIPSWLPNNQPAIKTTVSIPPGYGQLVVTPFNASSSQIELWWPSGLGTQPLYDVRVVLTNPSTNGAIADSRSIAFRVASLVTGNDTNPDYVKNNQNTDGSDSFGLMWRINGQAIFNRGANVIPMDDLEGRYSALAHRQMVLSARDGMMNTLRIWGGGVYLPQVFYDTCDEVGVLVLHDLMNRGSWQGIPQEILAYQHQARRLAHHPSIVVWNGCNECRGANNVVPNTVTVLVREDPSRVIWPSCPAYGWASGVERLTGLPNGKPLSQSPSNNIETHGPYQHGAGWPAVNGDFSALDPFPADTPPQEYPSSTINLGQPNQFTSEFGTVTWSSFESLSATLSPAHWSLHGGVPADKCSGSWNNNCKGNNPLAQRNYPCDNIYAVYYGNGSLAELDEVGEGAFKKQLFKCLIGSALKMKSYIEETRSRNCFGTLVWQLNEIWPTGGWGSLEYGSEVPGQVVGGRWKPTHYWMRKSLFTDILIACGVQGDLGSSLWCYVKNDSPNPVSGVLSVTAVEFANAATTTTIYSSAASLQPGPGTLEWIKVALPANFNHEANLLVGQLTTSTNTVLSYNTILLAPPYQLSGLTNFTVMVSVASKPNPDQTVTITLTKNSPALGLYVTLTTAANGRFSDNSFLMTTNVATVQYIPFSTLDLPTLTSTIRVEHLGNYV
jgi:beta-mannosidase